MTLKGVFQSCYDCGAGTSSSGESSVTVVGTRW